MAKVTAPLLSVTASGQFAQTLVFDKRGYVREYVIPANPQTVDQMAVRNILGDIQRELKQLGTDLRPQVYAALGYRWNSVIISELMANEHAAWDAYLGEFAVFQAGEKSAWAGSDPAIGNVLTDGSAFYAVASAFYDVCLRIAGDGLITLPEHDTDSTNATEWTAVAA